MPRTITITLPYPHKALSPNARCNWRTKAEKVKRARRDAKYAAMAAMRLQGWDEKQPATAAVIRPVFFCRTKAKRDDDNFTAILKPARDGFADAGLIVNDSGFRSEPPEFRIDKDDPRVEVTITEVAAGRKRSYRFMDEGSIEYEKASIEVALSHTHIEPCRDCGYPTVRGMLCDRCHPQDEELAA